MEQFMEQLIQFFQNADFSRLLIFWGVIIVFSAIFEVLVPGLVSIWFVFGGILALIALLCGASISLQLTLFLAGTLLALIFVRPFLRVFLNVKPIPTNVDLLIGMKGQVLETVNNIQSVGYVKVNGLEFRAKSVNDEVIEAESIIQVERIEGNTLFVRKV